MVKWHWEDTCIKNVKLKVNKIRKGCRYVGYFYYSENLNWAAQNLCLGRMRPEDRGLDIAALEEKKFYSKGKEFFQVKIFPNTRTFLSLASLEKFTPNDLQKDTAKWFNQSCLISNAVFVPAVALHSNFSINLGSLPKTFTHVLSTSREHTTGFFVKSFGGRCVSTVLTAGRQVTLFLLRCLCQNRRQKVFNRKDLR